MSSLPSSRALARPAAAALLLLAGACATPAGRISPLQRAQVDSTVRAAVAAEGRAAGAARSTRAVAVTPFATGGLSSDLAPLSYALADLLTTDLARSSQVELVDRLALDAALRELRLVESGRVDPATAPRVGRVIGASRLVLGSLAQPSPGQLGIQVTVADVATTQVAAALSATAPLDDLLEAEKALAFRVFERLGVTLTPAERAAVEQRQTRSLAALVAHGQGVRYELEGQLGQAASAYRDALHADPGFRRAAERLVGVLGGALSLGRALDAAAGRINETAFLPSLGSAADPAFFPQAVNLIITVCTGASCAGTVERRLP